VFSKLPRHWITFVGEVLDELQNVKNKIYEGQVIKGIRNGLGQLLYENGDVFKGNYKNGERSGMGVC